MISVQVETCAGFVLLVLHGIGSVVLQKSNTLCRTLAFFFCLAISNILLTALPAHSIDWSERFVLEGNHTISPDAVMNLIDASHLPEKLISTEISKIIKDLYKSGYFKDVVVKTQGDKIKIIVVEKPTIEKIDYEGFDIIPKSSFKDKLVTKKYTIYDEKKVSQDVRTMEDAYVQKGYYLAKVKTQLYSLKNNAVQLVFRVQPGEPILVNQVNFIGNVEFGESELQNYMGIRPYSWASMLNGTGFFRDDYLSADQQNLTFLYRDRGYAKASVASPIATLDRDKQRIAVTYYIDAGEKYTIDNIDFSGDLEYSTDEFLEKLDLKTGDLYRISLFNEDMKKLKNLYGDKGYAFAYVSPTFDIDNEKKTYSIHYNISKGEKTYFGRINIEGNMKTRDNVIRRAIRVAEGERYSATKLEKSKFNIQRLGFFETVGITEEDDKKNHRVNLRVLVKEKTTGALSASLGVSPGSHNSGVAVFGNLQYQEKNFLGRGYVTSLNLQVSPTQSSGSDISYSVGASFSNPALNDSPWGVSLWGNFSHQLTQITNASDSSLRYLEQNIYSSGLGVGRSLTDELRLNLSYSLAYYHNDPESPLIEPFYQSGRIEEVSQSITYDKTNNYLNPTKGIFASLSNTLGIDGFFGQYDYGRLTLVNAYYFPLNLGKHFSSNFKLTLKPQFVYQLKEDQPIPYFKRLTLGDVYYMKGFSNPGETISPKLGILVNSATKEVVNMITGGESSYYSSLEYFVPVIPEAGLRFVAFGEAGSVFDEVRDFNFDDFKYDVGFGIRWQTPIAPFRFEWAFPVDKSGLGDSHFIFSIGYDSFGSGT